MATLVVAAGAAAGLGVVGRIGPGLEDLGQVVDPQAAGIAQQPLLGLGEGRLPVLGVGAAQQVHLVDRQLARTERRRHEGHGAQAGGSGEDPTGGGRGDPQVPGQAGPR